MTLIEKLHSEKGLCTSIAHDDQTNIEIMKLILDAWNKGIAGGKLQAAHRAVADWQTLDDCPMEFVTYRYRIKP